jgi:RimJ/RimL family protein N-acetyltransferase
MRMTSSARPCERDAMHVETPRLLIRPWSHDEAGRLLDIQSRLEVVKWLGDGEPVLMKDLDEAHERIERYHRRSESPPLGFWAIEVRAAPGEPGRVAGSVILLTLPNDDHGEVEIGWHLHPDSWGRGYATEAAAAVLQHGFDGGLPEIYALTHTDNEASKAVCRRLGMDDLGIIEKYYEGESCLFRMTPELWSARRGGTATG